MSHFIDVSGPVVFILPRFACIYSRQEANKAKISGRDLLMLPQTEKSVGFLRGRWGGRGGSQTM